MPAHYTCERCGKSFTARPAAKRKYCSIPCIKGLRPVTILDDGTALVPLANGKNAIIDACDAGWVGEYNWWSTAEGYVRRKGKAAEDRRDEAICLHQEVAQVPANMMVDHINGNTLDCRRENLRQASKYQNAQNRALPRNNTSGFKGVNYVKPRREGGKERWRVYIGFGGKGNKISVGYFDSPEEAALAYDKAARKLYGDFAKPNFPV